MTKARAAEWAVTPFRKNILNLGGIIVTFHFVALGWVFFALSSTPASMQVFVKLFGLR
jgi:D-alanyl-lipoteichoic acid acyltransferase DltB (MBOAT superfamily)